MVWKTHNWVRISAHLNMKLNVIYKLLLSHSTCVKMMICKVKEILFIVRNAILKLNEFRCVDFFTIKLMGNAS